MTPADARKLCEEHWTKGRAAFTADDWQGVLDAFDALRGAVAALADEVERLTRGNAHEDCIAGAAEIAKTAERALADRDAARAEVGRLRESVAALRGQRDRIKEHWRAEQRTVARLREAAEAVREALVPLCCNESDCAECGDVQKALAAALAPVSVDAQPGNTTPEQSSDTEVT